MTASGPLDFAGVAVGANAKRTFTVANLDATPTSQLKVRLDLRRAAFTLEPASLDLRPSESAPVTVTFAPTADGHAHAKIGLVASATNRSAVSTITRGYGGTVAAGSSGPTLASRMALDARLAMELCGLAVYGLKPDGTHFFAGNTVNTCTVPGGGAGTGDACVTNADSSLNGGTCALASTCLGGPNAGVTCIRHDDCPGSICPSFSLLDPEDMCSGGPSSCPSSMSWPSPWPWPGAFAAGRSDGDVRGALLALTRPGVPADNVGARPPRGLGQGSYLAERYNSE